MKPCTAFAVVLVFWQAFVLVHSSGCPRGMIGFRSKCYSLQSHYMQWADANNGCKIIGGQLATIDSYSVNNFLFRRFRRGQSLNAWFGLKRCTSYRWCYPNGRRSSYRRWNINEPNNVGRNENCVEMWDNGRWNDAPCTQRRPSFCEIPVNVDECSLGTATCHHLANCVNTVGSYTCTCKPGLTGNGTICEDINECSDQVNLCHPAAKCINVIGSYLCSCYTGYVGNGKSCTKISREHDKILERLEKYNKKTENKLTQIQNMLARLLPTQGNTKR